MSPSLRAKPYVGMHCDMVLLLQVTWSTMNVQRYDLVTSSRRPNPDLLHAMLVMLSATGAGACEAATRKALPGSAAAARDVAAYSVHHWHQGGGCGRLPQHGGDFGCAQMPERTATDRRANTRAKTPETDQSKQYLPQRNGNAGNVLHQLPISVCW